ncbi:MAG: copper-binding protein [Polaromonas sp.]|nr:copper-binding protein [Polaromonas sp.]
MPHFLTPAHTVPGLLLTALLWSGTAAAQSSDNTHHSHHPAPSAPTGAADASALPWVHAEVRRVDMGAGKVTLKHGAISNLDMPGMTMVFGVPDRAQLTNLQPGDAVQFTADKVNGQYVVVNLRPLPGGTGR